MNPNFTSQPMSLEEARQVPMMFERYQRRTLGSLLDSGELQQKDLVYASQNAFNERLKEAAKVIIHHLQHQLTATNVLPPLNVIASKHRSYAERKQFQYTFLEGTVMGIFLGFAVFWCFNILFSEKPERDPEAGARFLQLISTSEGMFAFAIIIILLLVFIGLVFFVPNWIADRLEELIQRHRKGQRAEERVLNGMYAALDANWWLFRNLELPKRKADMDFVLVGQKGIWVFEVKFYEGEYRNRVKDWEAHIGSKWKPAFKNPTLQALGNAKNMSQFLNSQNIAQWVNPVVIWANPESILQVESPYIPVWTLGCVDISS